MLVYTVNTNYVEHDMNGDKYILKIGDGDLKYPKLYILNNTSYDIYKFVLDNPKSCLNDIFFYIVEKYFPEKDSIKVEDIELCTNDFVNAGIFDSEIVECKK
jgi:hypothetical protein